MEGEGSILEVTGLEKSYGRNKVLKGVASLSEKVK